MRRLVLFSPVLACLALALCAGCAQRATGPEASRAVAPEAQPQPEAEAAPEPEPDTAAPVAAPRFRTVELGYFNEMIEQFAAAETLLLRMEAQPQGFQLVRKEFELKRPGRFRARHDLDGRGGERICDGKTLWIISRARKEFVEIPPVPGRTSELDFLADLFQRARDIATGADDYAETLAAAQQVETETIEDQPCDVVGVKLDHPPDAEAKIWLTQTPRLPRRVRLISANGVIDYEVRTLETGVELDDAIFTFTPGPDWTGRAIPLRPPAQRRPHDARGAEDEPTEAGAPEKPPGTNTDDQKESPNADTNGARD